MISKFKYFNNKINSKDTFDNIDLWLKELKTHANPDAKVFLIGNKNDLEEKRQVPKDLATKYKEDFGLDLHMECSAKSGFNSRDVFLEATKMLYKDYLQYRSSRTNSFVSDNSQAFDNKNKDGRSSKIVLSNDANNTPQKPKSDGCC